MIVDDQDSILNELLEQIKSNEKKNDDLRIKIEQKREDISKLDINSKKQEKIDLSDLKKMPTPEEDEIASKKALENYKNIKLNQYSFESNIIDYLIEYTSQEHHSNLYIMGDFTKWEMIPMKKYKETFTYRVILLKGFKYYYSFQAGDQIILDYNNIYEENPRTLQVQNVIDLSENNKEICFDYKTGYNILETLEKNYLVSKIDINEDEFLFLSKLKNHVVMNKEVSHIKKLKYNKLLNDINTYFDNSYKYVNPFVSFNKLSKLRIYFKNKIIVKNPETDNKNILTYYRIVSLSENYLFQCAKLYDSNHIKVNPDYYSHYAFFFYVSPKQISFSPIKPDSKLFHLLSNTDSKKILEEYNKDETSILKAYFKTLYNLKNINTNNNNTNNTTNDDKNKNNENNNNDIKNKIPNIGNNIIDEKNNNNINENSNDDNINMIDNTKETNIINDNKIIDSNNKNSDIKINIENTILNKVLNTKINPEINNNTFNANYPNQFTHPFFRRNIFLVTPERIEPENINKEDYEFYYSLNKITRVRNKIDGTNIRFEIVDLSLEKAKRPNRLEIYYSVINNKINIIHCHVLDKNLRDIKMIVQEIDEKTDPHILKKDEKYIKNNQLLLLVMNSNPFKLYFQGKKVKMNSIKLELNKYYLFQSPNMDNIFNKMYVSIKDFSPKKNNYEIIEQCNEYSYSFANYENSVEVQVIFDPQKNYVIEPIIFAVSPCLLKKILPYEEHVLNQKIPKEKKNFMTEMEKYFFIGQKMVELRKYNNKEKIEKMTPDEKNAIIKELEKYNKDMEEILKYIENNEMWENIDEAANMAADINDIIKKIKN